jgi:hypothetical protein
MVAGSRIFSNAIPFMTHSRVDSAYFFIRARGQRNLQREIDKLNDIEREGGR